MSDMTVTIGGDNTGFKKVVNEAKASVSEFSEKIGIEGLKGERKIESSMSKVVEAMTIGTSSITSMEDAVSGLSRMFELSIPLMLAFTAGIELFTKFQQGIEKAHELKESIDEISEIKIDTSSVDDLNEALKKSEETLKDIKKENWFEKLFNDSQDLEQAANNVIKLRNAINARKDAEIKEAGEAIGEQTEDKKIAEIERRYDKEKDEQRKLFNETGVIDLEKNKQAEISEVQKEYQSKRDEEARKQQEEDNKAQEDLINKPFEHAQDLISKSSNRKEEPEEDYDKQIAEENLKKSEANKKDADEKKRLTEEVANLQERKDEEVARLKKEENKPSHLNLTLSQWRKKRHSAAGRSDIINRYDSDSSLSKSILSNPDPNFLNGGKAAAQASQSVAITSPEITKMNKNIDKMTSEIEQLNFKIRSI